jgi:hypothetical protein
MEDYELEDIVREIKDIIPKSMNEEESVKLKGYLKRRIRRKSLGAFGTGAFIGAMTVLVGVGIGTFFYEKNHITIRKTDNVEQEYVIPSKLEDMSVKNLDLTGKPETTLRYDGKDYLWKVDKDGKPVCVPYEIEPSKYIYTPPKIIISKIRKLL